MSDAQGRVSRYCPRCRLLLHYLGAHTPAGRVILFCPNGHCIELIRDDQVVSIDLDNIADNLKPRTAQEQAELQAERRELRREKAVRNWQLAYRERAGGRA